MSYIETTPYEQLTVSERIAKMTRPAKFTQKPEVRCLEAEKCGWQGSRHAAGDTGEGGRCPHCLTDVIECD